jgi:N-acylneuraminate cytidylyltransferase
MTGTRILPLVIDPRLAVDIDTEDQLSRAEWALGRGEFPVVRPGGPFGLSRIKLVVFDFDGVMTDNRVYVMEDGREAVACSRGDGMGLAALKRAGFEVAVLSTETNRVVAARCGKLDVPCRQGLGDKGAALRALVEEAGVALEDVVFVGNDANDLECMRMAGLAVAVADAHPAALGEARWVLSKKGGRGAVRELCDLLLETRGK